MNIADRQSPLRGQLLFLILLAFELIQYFDLILDRRLVFHDTFFNFSLFYYFLNSVITSGEIPQWIPYLCQGSSATWYYSAQGNGFLAQVLLHTGSLLQNINFLHIFHAVVLFDKFLLIVGVWLLSRYYFTSVYTSFFVTLSISCSSIWVNQIYFNFHLFYAVPLILYFFHTFLDTKKWRYALYMINLFCLQAITNPAYFIPAISFVIFLYMFFYCLCNKDKVWDQLKSIRFGPSFILCALFSALSLFVLYSLIQLGMDEQIVKFSPGRNIDGTVPLDQFLSHGDSRSMFRWMELFLGFSLYRDYTLYLGIITLPFILLGTFLNCTKKSLPIILIIVTLNLVIQIDVFAKLVYHLWPLMKYYRHLSLLSPFIKIFLCFLAGFGLEVVLTKEWNKPSLRSIKLVFYTIIITFTGLAIYLFTLSSNIDPLMSFTNLLGHTKFSETSVDYTLAKQNLPNLFKIASLRAILVAIVFAIICFCKERIFRNALVVSILIFSSLDILTYACFETYKRTMTLTEEQYQTLTFYPSPYVKKRTMDWWNNDKKEKILSDRFLKRSPSYWTMNAFLFNDQAGTSTLTLLWQKPYDQFMKAYWGQNFNDPTLAPKGFTKYGPLEFPIEHPGAVKFAGLREDKIQFFIKAHFLADDQSIAKNITDPNYTGDSLFLSSTKNTFNHKNLTLNQRLGLPYEVRNFNSNHLIVNVNNPTNQSIWMLYSDIWHPRWQATRNGQPTEIYKANLAYKAVELKSGQNTIHFQFHSSTIQWLYRFVGFNSLLWIIYVLGWVVCLSIRGSLKQA